MRKLNSDFALISVKGEQAVDLERRLLLDEKIEVVIRATLHVGPAWGNHDGIDQEFALQVEEAEYDIDI